MRIYYENKFGTLRLDGGQGLWSITDSSGLELPEKTFQTVSYAASPGQLTLREHPEARVITLRGDCRADREALHEAMRILNQGGQLSVIDKGRVRRADVYCSHFELKKRKGCFREFILQLTADDPYFEGESAVEQALYSRKNLVQSQFSLPCVFTTRLMSSVVINEGDAETEPVFTIVCKNAGELGEKTGILIENQTTGAVLNLRYVMQTDEVVTVDIPGRQITSNLISEENNQGNLIYCLSMDTVMKSLSLRPGENRFEVKNLNVGSDIVVTCRFFEKYLEAVI